MLNLLLFIASYLASMVMTFRSLPVFAFVLYQVVYFYAPQLRYWGDWLPNISYSFIASSFMIVIVLLNFKDTKQNRIFRAPQLVWMSAVIGLFYIANLYAVLPTLHAFDASNFIKVGIVMLLAYKLIDTIKKLDISAFAYIYGCWYIGFIMFQTGRNSGDRLEGVGTIDAPTSNGIAAAIAPALIMCLFYFWQSKKLYQRALFAVAGAFIANGVVLINSRGSFVAVIVGAAWFMLHMYFSPFKAKAHKMSAILLTVMGLSAALYVADDLFIERMVTLKSETQEVSEDEETGSTRIIFWKSAMKMAKDHPWGAGTGGFNYYAPIYLPQDLKAGKSRNRAVHSTWFEALTEIGYLGMFCFCMMMWMSFYTLQKCKKHVRKVWPDDDKAYFRVVAFQSALITFAVSLTFINRLRGVILYWLVMFSACLYNIYIVKRSEEQAPATSTKPEPTANPRLS